MEGSGWPLGSASFLHGCHQNSTTNITFLKSTSLMMLVWCYVYVESSFLHKELRKFHTRLVSNCITQFEAFTLYLPHTSCQMGFRSLCALPTSMIFLLLFPGELSVISVSLQPETSWKNTLFRFCLPF